MRNQKENYSEPSLVKDTRRQHMRGKMVKINLARQEKTYVELNFQNVFCYVNVDDPGTTTASVKAFTRLRVFINEA